MVVVVVVGGGSCSWPGARVLGTQRGWFRGLLLRRFPSFDVLSSTMSGCNSVSAAAGMGREAVRTDIIFRCEGVESQLLLLPGKENFSFITVFPKRTLLG